MAIWKHDICEYPVDRPGTPVGCPFGTIPENVATRI